MATPLGGNFLRDYYDNSLPSGTRNPPATNTHTLFRTCIKIRKERLADRKLPELPEVIMQLSNDYQQALLDMDRGLMDFLYPNFNRMGCKLSLKDLAKMKILKLAAVMDGRYAPGVTDVDALDEIDEAHWKDVVQMVVPQARLDNLFVWIQI